MTYNVLSGTLSLYTTTATKLSLKTQDQLVSFSALTLLVWLYDL